jgi:hypothetical protein
VNPNHRCHADEGWRWIHAGEGLSYAYINPHNQNKEGEGRGFFIDFKLSLSLAKRDSKSRREEINCD